MDVEAADAGRDAVLQLHHLPLLNLAPEHDADVRARAADVHGDRVLVAELPCDGGGGEGASGRPGLGELDRAQPRLFEGQEPAARVHVPDAVAVPEAGAQIVGVAMEHRRRHRVEGAGADALVLPDAGVDVHGQGHEDVRRKVVDDLRHAPFVRGIRVGVVEGYGKGLDFVGQERLDRRRHVGFRERLLDLPSGVDAPRDLGAQMARDERRDVFVEKVEGALAERVADLEHVPEPGAGDEPQLPAGALDQQVRDEGGAVHEVADVLGRHTDLVTGGEDPLGETQRAVQHLAGDETAGRGIQGHEIGERPSDVDTDLGPIVRLSGHARPLPEEGLVRPRRGPTRHVRIHPTSVRPAVPACRKQPRTSRPANRFAKLTHP